MSWIFTIVFSGLLFSSNAGTVADRPAETVDNTEFVTTVGQDESERFEQTYPLSANGRVSISNVNGSIVAEAWDRNEVKLIAVKTADSKERLQEVEIKIDSKPDSFSVETNYDNWKQKNTGDRWRNDGKLVVEYQLMLPRGAVLNEIETVNGSVTVSDFTNVTKVSAVNGTVKASNLRGTADLSTVNGEVAADFTSLDSGSKISLGTVNGKVNLMIPSDSNATVKVDSLNGNIVNDFGLPVRKGKYVGRDLYGKLGSGEVRIKLESVNGDLKILRQNDGKSLSPATNLLPQKEKDDEDWESGVDADIQRESAKAGREVSRTARITAVAAMKEVQREMAKVQPEMARIAVDSAKIAAETMKSERVQTAIRDGLKQQAAVLARISDAAFFPSVPRVEKKSELFPMKGKAKVTVNARGCAVKITGWDRNEVQYSVTQFSNSRNPKPIGINENHDDSSLTLTIDNGDASTREGNFFDDAVRAHVEIFVPRKSDLKISTNGEIRLEGVSGEIELKGEGESINVRDVDGKLHVSSVDGRIRVIGFKGEIVGETVDGTMGLEGDFLKLSAKGDTGNIVITVPENANAEIVAASPDVKIEGLPLVLLNSGGGTREYKLGAGGVSFKVATDGEIFFRSANLIGAGM